MFKNYFITTIRNLLRNKVNSIINIIGLSVSIACCIAIYVFIKHEETFDAFHAKADRIYRVVHDTKTSQGMEYGGSASFPLATALRADFPQLETITQLYTGNHVVVQVKDAAGNAKKFEDKQMTYADGDFFKTFDFPLLAGSKNKLLSSPDEVVLSRTLADNFFGKKYSDQYDQLIGKTIIVNKSPYRISAIMEDMPRNSNIACHLLISYANFAKSNERVMQDWKNFWSESYAFVTLPENYSRAQFEKALIPFKNKYLDKDDARATTFHAQPLLQVHTDELYGGTYYVMPSVLLIAFITMGIVVLLTACINFINLATAQSLQRAKEVGIRKTLGSRNWQLIMRFMAETFVLIVMASGIGVLLANWFLIQFNNYLLFIVELNLHIDASIILFLLLLAVVITFFAGFYPAKIMAAFRPIQALKSTIQAYHTGFANRFSLRKGLMVTQFMVTQLLIIGTIVVATQTKYFYSQKTGYQKEGVITVEMTSGDEQKLALFRNELMSHPEVSEVTFSSGPPMAASNGFSNIRLPQWPSSDNINSERKWVDANYLSTFKIPIVAGRDLRESDRVFVTDSMRHYNALLNKKAAASLGFKTPAAALGQTIQVDDKEQATIVGVTDDFHNVSLQREVAPCLLFNSSNWIGMASIRMNTTRTPETLDFIRQSWEKLYPDDIYKSMTLDDYIQRNSFYIMEDIMYQGFKVFVVLSIVIGCMGLYGLVSFLALQRQKEIGIRKVLGASVNTIVYLFSKEFTWLVLIAFAVAAPVGYWAMNTWLQTFANRIDLNVGYFVIALFISLFIAATTISFQAIKAAVANPVKSLRSE